MPHKEIPSPFKELMAREGILKTKDLARLSGLHKTQVIYLLFGHRKVGPETLARICVTLRTTPDEILPYLVKGDRRTEYGNELYVVASKKCYDRLSAETKVDNSALAITQSQNKAAEMHLRGYFEQRLAPIYSQLGLVQQVKFLGELECLVEKYSHQQN